MARCLIRALLGLLFMTGAAAAQTCSSLPYTLTNGQTADASQVMADLNYLLTCVTPATGTSPVVGTARGLTAQQASATTLTMSADEVIVETALGAMAYRVTSPSLTLDISTTGANGMDTGSAPTSGDLSVYLIYNPTTATAALLGTLGTTSNGSVYTGSNMPSGYTASALVSSLKTNSSAQLSDFTQVNRSVYIPAVNAITGGTASSPTAVSISSIVPANARTISGDFGSTNTGGGWVVYIQPTASTTVGRIEAGTGGTNAATIAPFSALPLTTTQTFYYFQAGGGSPPVAQVTIASYSF